MRFRPRRTRGHVESYFLRVTDVEGRRALWLKSTVFHAKGAPASEARAEAWAIAFDRDHGHVAHKATVPLALARFPTSATGLDISVAGCSVSEDRVRGTLGDIAWDFAIENHAPCVYMLPSSGIYEAPLSSSRPITPMPDLTAKGTVTVQGRTWSLDEWRGSLAHNWGPRHTHLYAWTQVSQWDDTGFSPDGASDLFLEAGAGHLAVGRFVVPAITLVCVRWRGVRYDWNGVADVVRARSHIEPRAWTFRATGPIGTLEAELCAETDDFVGLTYANPSGPPTYCLNSKLATARVTLTVSGRRPVTVHSKTAALEIGTHDPDHGVRMVL
jgi:hypothetical protein